MKCATSFWLLQHNPAADWRFHTPGVSSDNDTCLVATCQSKVQMAAKNQSCLGFPWLTVLPRCVALTQGNSSQLEGALVIILLIMLVTYLWTRVAVRKHVGDDDWTPANCHKAPAAECANHDTDTQKQTNNDVNVG
jgi:hypothetical protein